MSISKIFILDFFNKKKVTRMILILVLVPLFLSQMLSDMSFSSRFAGIIGVTIALASTAYTLSSYATKDKLKLYISLPISPKRLIWGLIATLYIDTFFEKLAVFIIAAFFIFADPLSVVLSATFTSLICVVCVVTLLLAMNAKKRILMWTNALSLIGVVLSAILLSDNSFYWILINLCMLAIPIITIFMLDSSYLMINHQAEKRMSLGLLSHNYFILTMVTEKIYLVNTLVITAVVTGFILMFPTEPVILNLAWCMGAINTPAITMLSGDKWISKQVDMLPDTKKSVINMYLRFLTGYFLLINTLIFSVISLKLGSFQWMNALLISIVTALEVAITIIFERKWRITDWQIRKELWRHPRKYIAPVVIFIITSAISIFL